MPVPHRGRSWRRRSGAAGVAYTRESNDAGWEWIVWDQPGIPGLPRSSRGSGGREATHPARPPTDTPKMVVPRLDQIIRFGADRAPLQERQRVATGNRMAVAGVLLTVAYSLSYLIMFESPVGFVVNLGFALAYGIDFLLVRSGQYLAARGSIFVVFILHIFTTTILFFPPESDLHLYLVLVGPAAFFLFDRHERIWRDGLAIASVILYLVIEVTPPLLVLGPSPGGLTAVLSLFTMPIVVGVLLMVERGFLGEIEHREVALDKAARTDALTGIANRPAAFERAEELLQRSRARRDGFEVLMIDIDHFKQVNDRYGHVAGDAVLVEAAHALRRSLREQDIVGRFGGEEFFVAVAHADGDSTASIAERLRRSVEALDVTVDGVQLDLTVSIGVARLADPGVSLDALVEQADRALYQAKAGGRNRCVVATTTSAIPIQRPIDLP